MKHSFSVSELQTVCSVHVANDPSQVVSVYYVRDSGVVSVEELDSQLPKHWTVLVSAKPITENLCSNLFI